MASERPKPGDRVLVEARLCEWPEDEFQKVTAAENNHSFGRSFYPRTEHVHPHPGIDPALIGELVEAVREYGAAHADFHRDLDSLPPDPPPTREQRAAWNKRMEAASKRLTASLSALRDLAAQIERADAGGNGD